MCKVIKIENIISSHFLTHQENNEVDISTLNDYKRKLENGFNNEFVYVDNTRDAWLNAMNRNWDLFSIIPAANDDIIGEKIRLIGSHDQLKQCEDYFNAKLPFREEKEWKIYRDIFSGATGQQCKRSKI
ncbi:MAG: hypothetical protein LBL94_11185 [Prevotellaceae bacterium]|jgi:hypothetical protein|nr:hypothetical protein [Prevotellaceae bacterium]